MPKMGEYTLADDIVRMAAHAANYGLHTLVVRKTADQTVNNSTVLVDDDDLKFAVGANEVWFVLMRLLHSTSIVADLKVGVTVPAGTAFCWGEQSSNVSALAFGDVRGVLSATVANPKLAVLHGVLTIGAVAGVFQIQWAQNTAEVSDTKVLTNSCLFLTQLV